MAGKVRDFHLISRERWDQHGYLWGGIVFAMVICSLGAVGNWYRWLHGRTDLRLPGLLTLAALVILAIAPRRMSQITASLAGVFVLSILQMALRRFPPGSLELIGGSGVLLLICSYAGVKLKGSERRTVRLDPSGPRRNDHGSERPH